MLGHGRPKGRGRFTEHECPKGHERFTERERPKGRFAGTGGYGRWQGC